MAADCSATGFPANGWFCTRDTQSIAFFKPPGIENNAVGGANRVG
jgi:hypothetical protein